MAEAGGGSVSCLVLVQDGGLALHANVRSIMKGDPLTERQQSSAGRGLVSCQCKAASRH